MTATRQIVSDKLLAYLNRDITLDQLVDWAKNSVVDDALEPAEDKKMLTDILAFLALAISWQERVIWDICIVLLEKLGFRVEMDPVDWTETNFIEGMLDPTRNVNILNDIMGYLTVINNPQIPVNMGMYARILEKSGLKVRFTATDERGDLNS